jgi:hypothetical protein
VIVSDQVSRRDVALILQRTAELEQQGAADDAVSRDELLKIGEELGVSTQALGQALAESRAGLLAPITDSTLLDRIYGESVVVARRFVPGTVAEVRAHVEAVFGDQGFVALRPAEEGYRWTRSSRVRMTYHRGHKFWLPTTARYDVRVVELPGGKHPVLVQIEADIARVRRGRANNALTAVLVGAIGAVIGALVAPMPIELAPVLGGAGLATLGPMWGRSYYREVRDELELALAGLLDELEREPVRVAQQAPRDPVSRFFGSILDALTGR